MRSANTRAAFLRTGGRRSRAARYRECVCGERTTIARERRLLDGMPGFTGAAIRAADGSILYERRPNDVFSVGSCFKAFVAAEAYRAIDAGNATLVELLPLDESVYIPGSTAFVPELAGKVPLQVVLQEMIAYSDNTATDIAIKRFGWNAFARSSPSPVSQAS